MKRLTLLLSMLALTVLLAGTVMWFSPYTPAAAPAPENIEEIWEIEDARQESDATLVTRLENCGVPLGYDAPGNTFYCTLGLGHGDEWPEIRLSAPENSGVRLVFIDDYAYDSCAEAIREGYSYEVLAYTDTQYAYFNIVFTGLMQVIISSAETLSEMETPVRVSVNTPVGALVSPARTHYRGGITMQFDKHGYKIEFTRTLGGQSKVYQDVPALGVMNEFILVPMWFDNHMLRDRLSWMLYGEMVGADQPYGARRNAYAEVFVNDRLEGVYMLLEPYDHGTETGKLGAEHAASDTVYCACLMQEVADRPSVQGAFVEGRGYALHYAVTAGDPFGPIRDYVEIGREPDDEVFIRRMKEQVDLESLLRYHLILESFGLGDNVFNNMFLWAANGSGKTVYRFVPWDMDMAWGEDKNIDWTLEDCDGWIYFPLADRLLNLNPDGFRQKWAEAWRQLRETVLTEENIAEKLAQLSGELNDSGAMLRNAERWNSINAVADTFEIQNYVQMRFAVLDRTAAYFEEAQGDIPMLIYDDPGQESGRIYGFDGL